MSMQPTHSSRRILLPARGVFVALSLILALLLNMAPVGYIPGMPDWVALILAFWCIREPRMLGMGSAFVLGIIMDVADASVMGQHALAYVLLAFFAAHFSRRILWFPLLQQALHVLPLLFGCQIVQMAARMIGGADFPGVLYFLSSFVATALWYPLTYLLLLPQYRAVDHDENRPI